MVTRGWSTDPEHANADIQGRDPTPRGVSDKQKCHLPPADETDSEILL